MLFLTSTGEEHMMQTYNGFKTLSSSLSGPPDPSPVPLKACQCPGLCCVSMKMMGLQAPQAAFLLITALCFLSSCSCIEAKFLTKKALHAKQAEAAVRHLPRAAESQAATNTGVKNITFTDPRASAFYVDGSTIPDVDWDVGPSWSGLLPISSDPNETRKLFFWFFPPGPQGNLDDLIFWTNGGPGCSSLEGLLQENGDEDQVAAEVVGFLQQFLDVFKELRGKKLYVTGESYAGMYVPYITNYIFEHPTALNLSMTGFWVSDPVLGWDVVQTQIPAVDFVHKYQGVFSFKYVGLLPLPGRSTEADPGCDVWDEIFDAALKVNPAFDIYRIFDTWPILWDVLGFPGSFPQVQSPIYFDREDVKRVIHAPLNVTWEECSDINVFPRGDHSLPPAFTVLPSVIEKSERAVIVHGLADFILIAEGTRIVIQNMTWNGKQGFQTPIQNDSFVVEGMGALGTAHTERGLTFFEVALSGHM
ncbi:hypothetical protein BN946_scf185011.g21 [Trametes cinnabarina]|uniref:Carboxypeptidase n=1 Tax=Pycnoporus cinnabarinus TaxID=5643 RepID=A0A060SPA9_PYCCI|nr:hypothetical protein BN946_scf185011.g21 [Trametes cinnabarina]